MKTSIKHQSVISSEFDLGCAKQGKTEKPQVSGIRILCCHGILGFLQNRTAYDRALVLIPTETEMCFCCRGFSPNEWELVDN